MKNIFPLERSDCRGSKYCKKWRICDRCARIRASQFADRAKDLEARHGKLMFVRETPQFNTESEMKKLRDCILRKKLAPAGLWTIETGELFAGLHLNLIVPKSALQGKTEQFSYQEEIRSSVRAVASYIMKRTGIPAPEQYGGRLMGEWGTIAQMVMASADKQTACVQACMVERTLTQRWQHHGITHFTQTKVLQIAEWEPPVREKSREEYAEIARRNLSNIYATIARSSQK